MRVREGDLLLMATDGVFDNLFDELLNQYDFFSQIDMIDSVLFQFFLNEKASLKQKLLLLKKWLILILEFLILVLEV